MIVIKNKIDTFYWEIFFSAYWIVYNLGEKESCHSNAAYLLELITFVLLNSLLLFSRVIFKFETTTSIWFVFINLIISLIGNALIIYSKNGYKKQLDKYSYLSKPTFKKYRIKTVLLPIAIAIFSLFLSAALNKFIE